MSFAPKRLTPFNAKIRRDILRHVTEVRRCFDWPGAAYHDAAEPQEKCFKRWYWHGLALLRSYHNNPHFVSMVSQMAGEPLKPSYVFLSMYGPDGVCPKHTDRPQCHMTVDYLISTDAKDKPWPLIIDDEGYCLEPGHAILYSGTQQPHERRPLNEASDATYCNLAFFHFVPVGFAGPLN